MKLLSLLIPGLLVIIGSTPGACAAGAPASTPEPVTIIAGADWISLRPELDIEPGTALDFSRLGFADAPAGKHGRVVATPDGQFAFVDSPDHPRRFYGVNLCFGAQYLSHDEADRLAERLLRLGYNAVRIHHYERDLTRGQDKSTELNPAQIEKLDYLAAALIQRGFYLTTDLFVSRGIPYREIGMERDGQIPMDTFKVLVPVNQGAFANWKEFARNFLTHTNAYTKRPYAQEPALAWLSMINEGNYGNFYKDLRALPDWTKAWNHWLTGHYSGRDDLRHAWSDELKPDEDPAQGSVALPENLRGESLRARDCIAFFAATERDMIARMSRFLKEDLGCQALITDANSWTYFVTDQGARNTYGYVDDHFYIDHPQWVEQSWRLPSKCPNTSPIAEGAIGGRAKSFTRLLDKPFTITEYNYSAPGRFRGVGGILTGAMGALQGWGGIWRFAYSHSEGAIFSDSKMGYFDLASDPLSQAAERASLCLFLRGDLQPAPHRVALVMTEADLASPPDHIPSLHPKWHWMAWVTRVGTQVIPSAEQPPPADMLLPLGWKTPASHYSGPNVEALNPYTVADVRLVEALRSRSILQSDNPTDPSQKLFRSETGEITIDGPNDRLVLDTARTAGGYARAGQQIEANKSGVHIEIQGTDATVWVSALDDEPIQRSRRLLVTHLTDLQNSEIRYAEAERKTLLDWGHLPYLVRAGRARVTIPVSESHRYQVWALAVSGKRLAQLPVERENGALQFTADVAADAANGARMLYEVAAE